MIIKFLKPFSFLPALFLMYMIYSFSAQDGTASAQLSYKVSYKIVEIGGNLLGADFQDWEIDKLANRFNGPVRKLAHMTEYFALAIAVAFPLYVYGLRGILLLIAAGVICVGFACGDEYHQSQVAGRGPSKRDVLIDSFGVFWGIILVRIIGWTGRNTIFRPFSRKKKYAEARYEQRPEDYARTPDGAYPPGSRQWPGAGYGNQPGGYTQYPDGRRRPGAGYGNQPGGYAQYTDGRQRPGAGYGNQPGGYAQYPGGRYAPPGRYPFPPQNSYQQPSPYGYPMEDDYEPEEPVTSSDYLSEDMSFRKLVSDLKDQKQTRRESRRKTDGGTQDNK